MEPGWGARSCEGERLDDDCFYIYFLFFVFFCGLHIQGRSGKRKPFSE